MGDKKKLQVKFILPWSFILSIIVISFFSLAIDSCSLPLLMKSVPNPGIIPLFQKQKTKTVSEKAKLTLIKQPEMCTAGFSSIVIYHSKHFTFFEKGKARTKTSFNEVLSLQQKFVKYK